jgi:hypothetical protein
MTSILSALPDALIRDLLLEWVIPVGIGRLDSALCNRLERANFLRVAHTPNFILFLDQMAIYKPGIIVRLPKFNTWLILRQIAAALLDVDALVEQDDNARSAYLKKFGEHVISVSRMNYFYASTRATDSMLGELCALCPNVKVFNCQARLGAIGKTHVAAGWKQLTHLTVCISEPYENFVAMGEACQSLVKLEIDARALSQPPAADMKTWAKFFNVCAPTLRRITTRLTFDEATYRAIAGRCPLLEDLEVTTHRMNDAALMALADGCPNLSGLDLQYNAVGDAGMSAIARNGALTSLGLKDCFSVKDAGIQAIAGGCPLLRTLVIAAMRHVADPALTALGQHCHQLRAVHLTRVGFTAAGLRGLAEGSPLLEELRVQECEHAGPGVEAVALNCPQLRILFVSDTQVPAKAVTALAQHCPLLEKVRVWGKKIGDAEIAALTTRCDRLTHLDVARTSATEQGLRSAVLQSTALKYIAVDKDADPSHGTAMRHRTMAKTFIIYASFLRRSLKGEPYRYDASESYTDAHDW